MVFEKFTFASVTPPPENEERRLQPRKSLGSPLDRGPVERGSGEIDTAEIHLLKRNVREERVTEGRTAQIHRARTVCRANDLEVIRGDDDADAVQVAARAALTRQEVTCRYAGCSGVVTHRAGPVHRSNEEGQRVINTTCVWVAYLQGVHSGFDRDGLLAILFVQPGELEAGAVPQDKNRVVVELA